MFSVEPIPPWSKHAKIIRIPGPLVSKSEVTKRVREKCCIPPGRSIDILYFIQDFANWFELANDALQPPPRVMKLRVSVESETTSAPTRGSDIRTTATGAQQEVAPGQDMLESGGSNPGS